MPRTSYAKNLFELENSVYRICGDVMPDGSYGQMWTRNEVRDAINRAVLEAVDRCGALREAAGSVDLVDGVNIYELPADCVRLLRISVHGIQGKILLPITITDMDMAGAVMSGAGDPLWFFREFLGPNQIGIYPAPGSGAGGYTTFDRDSDYGLLRGIQDADGPVLPFDSGDALRRIRGVPFSRSGDGNIIRELKTSSPYGNMAVHYIRAPELMVSNDDYPDYGIPEWFHGSIKYGASTVLLRYRRSNIEQARAKVYSVKWTRALMRLQRRIEHTGPMASSAVAI